MLRGLVRRQLADAERSGRDWQGVVDGIREQVGDLWRGLTVADRERFLRHLSRHWEVHRHRMAPSVETELHGLLDAGRLVVHRGPPDTSAFTRVVNCTGPQPVAAPGWSALVDQLIGDGQVRPDPLGLGLDTDPAGRLRRGDGSVSPWLSTLGQARRGGDYETTAIPEIRHQAATLAARLLAVPAVDGTATVAAGA